jgi:hypothetical protein
MQTDPKMLSGPYARVVLRDDCSVSIAADRRDPDKLLGPNDVSYVFLREDQAALTLWASEQGQRPGSNAMFRQAATEQYAGKLARVLMANVQIKYPWPNSPLDTFAIPCSTTPGRGNLPNYF